MTDPLAMPPVRCTFHGRFPNARYSSRGLYPPRFNYTTAEVPGQGSGNFDTVFPPAVGDRIYLNVDYDDGVTTRGCFEVIKRGITYPAKGSKFWPVSAARPTVAAFITYIVQPAEELFDDEAPPHDEGKDDQ